MYSYFPVPSIIFIFSFNLNVVNGITCKTNAGDSTTSADDCTMCYIQSSGAMTEFSKGCVKQLSVEKPRPAQVKVGQKDCYFTDDGTNKNGICTCTEKDCNAGSATAIEEKYKFASTFVENKNVDTLTCIEKALDSTVEKTVTCRNNLFIGCYLFVDETDPDNVKTEKGCSTGSPRFNNENVEPHDCEKDSTEKKSLCYCTYNECNKNKSTAEDDPIKKSSASVTALSLFTLLPPILFRP